MHLFLASAVRPCLRHAEGVVCGDADVCGHLRGEKGELVEQQSTAVRLLRAHRPIHHRTKCFQQREALCCRGQERGVCVVVVGCV